jgi:hypothetical protein
MTANIERASRAPVAAAKRVSIAWARSSDFKFGSDWWSWRHGLRTCLLWSKAIRRNTKRRCPALPFRPPTILSLRPRVPESEVTMRQATLYHRDSSCITVAGYDPGMYGGQVTEIAEKTDQAA